MSLREVLDQHSYNSLRDMAEDCSGDLGAAVSAYFAYAANAGIGDVLLLRACEKLGVLPDGMNAAELIERWKV